MVRDDDAQAAEAEAAGIARWRVLRRRVPQLGHAGWGFGDQAVSSLSNFGVALAAARASDSTQYGAFSVAFATYIIGIGVARALISDVYAVRYAGPVDAHAPSSVRYPEVRGAWGAAFLVSLAGAVACLVAALIASGDLRGALLVVGIGLPILVVQDVARFICITRRDAKGAFTFDAAWVAAFAVLLAVVAVATGFPGATVTMALWVVGAACGLVVAVLRFRVLPGLRSGWAFARTVWRQSARYMLEWVSLGATVQLGYYVLGFTAGLALVGEVRAGILLVGPLNILVTGAAMLAVPELARRRRAGGGMYLPAILLSSLLGLATIVWFAVVALLPDGALRTLLGDAAADAQDLLPVLFVYSFFGLIAQGPVVALRATGNLRRGTKAALPVAPLLLFGAAIGAAITGEAWGALAAWTVAGVVSGVLSAWQLHLALQEPLADFLTERGGSRGSGEGDVATLAGPPS